MGKEASMASICKSQSREDLLCALALPFGHPHHCCGLSDPKPPPLLFAEKSYSTSLRM